MKHALLLLALLSSLVPHLAASQASQSERDDEGITWLIQHEGSTLPGAGWTLEGQTSASVVDGALRLVNEAGGTGAYRIPWTPVEDTEIIVEIRVRQVLMPPPPGEKRKPSPSWFPARDGSPVAVLVSDGQHQDGLVLFPSLAMTFTDRFVRMDTTDRFHTYRLVINGTDMSLWVDGERRVNGQNAFARKAAGGGAFLQFGSNARSAAVTGEALWESIRLGVRPRSLPPTPDPVKITISESWPIPRDKVKQTRPYLYDMGEGLLLMSVAQGPDALYGDYALLRSTDAGKTWAVVEGLDQTAITPLPMLRLRDGRIFGTSRWTTLQENGELHGKTFLLDAGATTRTMHESRLILTRELIPVKPRSDVVIFERHIFLEADEGIVASVWSRRMYWSEAEKRNITERRSHLLRTTDLGRTWHHLSTMGPGGEPAVARLSDQEWVAVIRGEDSTQMTQTFSHDAGRTWEPPFALEEGRVAPDLVLMSNGVLACSYGRPASCLMFSLDQGRTWSSHHVVSERVHFNYIGIREISPGRLLFVHDAPDLNAVYIDVDKVR